MGRLAPDSPSTLPGLSRRVAMFEGVAPRISVSTSTPSPLSSWRTSSWAWGRIASGSSWTVTPSCCTCSGRLPSTWLVPWMSASPRAPCATMRTPTMIPVSEVTAFRPSLTTAAGTINWERSLLPYGGFDSVEKYPGDIEAGLVGDFPEAGGAGDVDLGEPVPDHVQADEEQPLARELRPERVRDFQVSPREGLCDAGAPGGEVAARLARLGDARKAMRYGFPRDQQDALVALADFRDVALCHDRFCAAANQRFDDHVAVGIARGDAKHRFPAHSVERLEHHVAVSVDEFLELPGEPCHQRRRGEMRVFRDRQLLAVVADRARFVEHLRAILLRELQKPGARDVLAVERRVLAHEHHVEFIERRLLWRRDPIPGVLVAGESDAGSFADNPTALPHETFLQHEIQIVAALRGLDHHGVSRVLVNLERGQGIGDEGDSHVTKRVLKRPALKSQPGCRPDRVRTPSGSVPALRSSSPAPL